MKRERSVLELYGYYEPYLQKLGSKNLLEKRVTVKTLNIPSYVVQRAYREMAHTKFQGTIIEYLQRVSMRFTLWRVFVQSKETNPEKDIAEFEKLLDSASPEAVNFLQATFANPLHIGSSREFGDYAAKHQKNYKSPLLFDLITTGMYEWWMTVMKKEYVQSCKKILHESKQ